MELVLELIKVRYEYPCGNPCQQCCFKYLSENCNNKDCSENYYFKWVRK